MQKLFNWNRFKSYEKFRISKGLISSDFCSSWMIELVIVYTGYHLARIPHRFVQVILFNIDETRDVNWVSLNVWSNVATVRMDDNLLLYSNIYKEFSGFEEFLEELISGKLHKNFNNLQLLTYLGRFLTM